MKRWIAIAICLIFLASGLIRIGAGLGMMGQAASWWQLGGEFADALPETIQFFSEREFNLVGFTPFGYFAYILFMGLLISIGSLAQLWRKNWGLSLIGLYLVSHLALFVNFMTINPKILLWGLSVAMTGVLIWANRREQSDIQAQ